MPDAKPRRCALLWVLATTSLGNALAQGPAFRVGDRVQASPTSLADAKYWRTCTVTEVHEFVPKRAYSLQCDATPDGGSAGSFLVNQDWVRTAPAGAAAAAPAPAAAGLHAAAPVATATAPDTTGGGATCPASDANAGTEPERSLKQVIRAGFEHDAAPGADGRVTVTFETFSVGQPHAYAVYNDPREAEGKQVYPVRARFTACTDYRTRIVLDTRERAFACYAATGGAWACDVVAAANTNVRDVSRSIDKRAR